MTRGVPIVLQALEGIAAGHDTVPALMKRYRLSKSQVKRALSHLLARDLLDSTGAHHHAWAVYRLRMSIEEARRVMYPTKPNAKPLLEAWPMPVAFPPVLGRPRKNVAEEMRA